MAENCTTMALDTSDVSASMRTVPRWSLKFLQRILRFEAGKAYTLTISMPKQRDAEPTWTLDNERYIENQR